MDSSLRALLTKVFAVGTERRFAYWMLTEDPFFGRLPESRREEAVEFALAAGQRAADWTLERYGDNPKTMGDALKVSVRFNESEARAGSFIHYSEYNERPPSITLYRRSLEEVNELILAHGLQERIGIQDVTPVHLAHEIYHHLETKKFIPGTASFRVDTFKVGPIRFRTGFPSLSEMAADHFSGQILSLRIPPKALQFITLFAHNPDWAWELIARLECLPA
jgi:hypothetical protein